MRGQNVRLRPSSVKPGEKARRLARVVNIEAVRRRRARALLSLERSPDQALEARAWGDRGSRGAA